MRWRAGWCALAHAGPRVIPVGADLLLGLVLALLVAGYLLYALLNPERF